MSTHFEIKDLYFTYAVFDGTTLRLMKRTTDGPLNGDVETPGAGA